MTYLKNQKGIALVTALVFTLVTLGVVMAVLYLLNQQTKTSAAQKVYSTALQAAYGDAELFTKDLIPSLFPNDPLKRNVYWESMFPTISLDILSTDVCIQAKLHSRTADWTKITSCSNTPTPKELPDTTLILKGTNGDYRVYSKIVDTQVGNTDGSRAGSGNRYLSGDGVTGGNEGGRFGTRVPYLYTIEIQAEGATNPKEKANLSVLYAY